jgi:LmbE family N-acetylglucosaminyl deacetylase
MMTRRWIGGLVVAALVFQAAPTGGQMRLQPVSNEQGKVALALALRKLTTVGTFMMTTAHPDDENTGLLAMLSHGQGMRAVLVSATRGDGGQNEIGPELFDALAVLRTEELAAAHRFDGAEQFFTRAVDFGYSFSVDETLQRWGKEEILGDFVRLIRTIRPDVITGFIWEGTGGGQHHQTSTKITAEAFRAAADPGRFPEQLQGGLRPWQAKKVYALARFGGPPGRMEQPVAEGERSLAVRTAIYDPWLGRTYAEIGTEARSMHKCQGMNQLLMLPGRDLAFRYRLIDSLVPGAMDKAETSMFDGVDVSLRSLAAFAGATPPEALVTALSAITGHVDEAQRALDRGSMQEAAAPLARGLAAVRKLRGDMGTLVAEPGARYEIEFRLAQKQRQFDQALVLAHGIAAEALADDGVVVPGQGVKVNLVVGNRGQGPVEVKHVHFSGFSGNPMPCGLGTTEQAKAWECTAELGIPADEPLSTPYFKRRTDSARYDFDSTAPFGLPARPTPFRVAIDLDLSGQDVVLEMPVKHRYEGSLFIGEKRMELQVVPALAVSVNPEILVVPASAATTGASKTASRGAAVRQGVADRAREVRVTVTNGSKGPAQAEVALDVPAGWAATPAAAPVRFTREDDQVTVRFFLAPPAGVSPGHFDVKARATSGAASFDRTVQVVEYPHTERRHVVLPAGVQVKVLDVKMAPRLTVGYVMGVGDQVPQAIEQLGAKVELLDADALAWGDLSRYDVIVTGVRAYERRADLRANNQRLLDYASAGGTVVVQYNKFEFNEAQFGPYPAKVSTNRVTDETAPVRVLVPTHPVFTTPNAIDASTWDGWVQERGLYFLGDRDPKYVDLVETEDPFEFNKGVKRGALVEASVGKGRWIYLGLGLWRQLPAGTDGAYRLLANIVSLPKDPGAAKRPSAGH